MYESPPGPFPFEIKTSFDIAPIEEQERRRHAVDREIHGMFCKRVLCIADIDEGGNTHFAREYRGIIAEKQTVNKLPFQIIAGATNGMVESLRATRLSRHGPAVQLREVTPIIWNRRAADLYFADAGLSPGDEPIDMLIEFYGNSVIASDHWQSRCMYPDNEVAGDDLIFGVPEGVAVEELWLHVRFPEYGGLPVNISASIEVDSDGR
jgi:hypothetical protein